jgi:hypothetical protein
LVNYDNYNWWYSIYKYNTTYFNKLIYKQEKEIMSKNTLGNIGAIMALVGGSITTYLSGLPIDNPINWLMLAGTVVVALVGYFSGK